MKNKKLMIPAAVVAFALLTVLLIWVFTRPRYVYDGTSGVFCCGLTPVANGNDKYGYVDKNGRIAIQLKYTYAYDFTENGYAVVEDGELCFVIDTKGRQVGDSPFEGGLGSLPEKDVAPKRVKKDGKYGFIDYKAELVIENKFSEARQFHRGYAAVCFDNAWGFIDESGEWIIEPQFEYCWDFNSKGEAVVRDNGKYGLISYDGKLIAEPIYDENIWSEQMERHDYNNEEIQRSLDEQKRLYYHYEQRGEKHCYVDPDGNVVLTPDIDWGSPFYEDGYAVISKDGLYGVIDKNGKIVVRPKWWSLSGYDGSK